MMKTPNAQRQRTAITGARCFHWALGVGRWVLGVPVRHALLCLALTALAFADPPIRITVRRFADGSISERETNPSKRQSTETIFDSSHRMTHKVVYKLDDRLQAVSGIYYNAKGVIYQKSAYRLDGEDRIIQEVIYDAGGNLLGTTNYSYGMRNGSAVVINVDSYDANGNLIQSPRRSTSSKKSR